jgi:serine protease Do
VYVGGDMMTDIAVIAVGKTDLAELEIDDYRIAHFSDSDEMRIGDQVMAVGNALGIGKSATLGIVSMTNRPVTVDNITYTTIQTDAAINRGNSGGPLVNMGGHVIGINTFKPASNISGSTQSASIEGIGFAIPTSEFLSIVVEIMEYGTVRRPFIGITWVFYMLGSDSILSEYILLHGLPNTGALILEVHSGFLAYDLGLQPGDYIISYNGSAITSRDRFIQLIMQTEIGDEVMLRVLRPIVNQTGEDFASPPYEILTFMGFMRNFTTDPGF